MGYTNVRSLAGGFDAWKSGGNPIEVPVRLTEAQRARYSRHLLIPEVGEAGQAKLLASKVLLIGAGGLGSPSALYLAAAGVGTLGIVDDDTVDAPICSGRCSTPPSGSGWRRPSRRGSRCAA